jgi:KRAB domain-containing zinc finger protein
VTNQCSTCGQIFDNLYKLQFHERKKHNDGTREKNFICDHCNKRFAEKSYISRHMETMHFKVLRFQCQLCQKYFRKQGRTFL